MKILLRKISRVFRNIFLLVISITSIYPLLWTFMNAFKSRKQFSVDNMGLPNELVFSNFTRAIESSEMDVYFINSIISTILTVIIVIIAGFITGYVLSRYVFKAKKIVYSVFMLGMLIPIHGLMIPLFIQLKALGMLNNLASLAITYSAFSLPTAIFLVESFVKTIPPEMEEAAYIDGANIMGTMFRIIFPMTKPVLSTVVVLTFLNAWNEFPFALILINNKALKTIPIGMANFSGEFSVEYTQLLAGSVIAILPVLLVYAFFNRQIVSGMITGALKG